MKENMNSIEDIKHIRNIMERSTTFVSLTGWSGIVTGIIGLISFYLFYIISGSVLINFDTTFSVTNYEDIKVELIALAISSLMVSIISAFFLTLWRAKKNNQSIWNHASKQFAFHSFIPLAVGGILILALIRLSSYELVCPLMLIFFGLALLNSSKFVKPGMQILAIIELSLGITAAFWVSLGAIFWGMGFGAAIFIYGILMYLKYER